MLVKGKTIQYVCSQCGHVETKWLGRCPECGSWNTFEEESVPSLVDMTKSMVIAEAGKVQPLKDVQVEAGYRFPQAFPNSTAYLAEE